MSSDERVYFNLEGMPNLHEVKFLVFENLPIENFKSLNLPKKLPNLKTLKIYDCPLKSLEGLPYEMLNLTNVGIAGITYLQNLKGFPKYIPKFQFLGIVNLPELCSLEGLPPELPKLNNIRLQDLPKLHSLKGLPHELPRLKKLEIHDVELLTLKNIPENLHLEFYLEIWNYKPKEPVLFDFVSQKSFEGFHVLDYIIKDFSFLNNLTTEDFKNLQIYLYFEKCLIHSFEGFPEFPKNTNFKEIFDKYDKEYNITEPSIIFAIGTKIRSLSGLSLPFLKYFLPYYSINDNLFDFAPHGKKLLENCINHKYIQRTESHQSQSLQNEYEEVQIFHRLLQKAFIPENLPPLYEYFKTPAIELAHQYISNPANLPPPKIERLIHEADHNIRKILENSLPPKNPVILQISQKIAFEAPNGLKILR